MYVTDIQSIEHGKYLVFFEEGQVLVLYKKDIQQFKIFKEKEYPEEKFERIEAEVLYPRAKNHAFNYLSYRGRSAKEMVTYLKKKHYSEQIVARTMAFLEEYRYIDDRRFTESFIQNKMRSKPYGARAFYYLLGQKGVPSEIVNEVLEELGLNEVEHCLTLIKKRVKGNTVDIVQKKRLYGYLQRRGFGSNTIFQALNLYELESNDQF